MDARYHPTDDEPVRAEDPYGYLRWAIVTLGVAAGIAIVAWYGRFDTIIDAIVSLALFPLVLGIAFFVVFLTVALMRDRYSVVKGILALILIAFLLALFPFFYTPGSPLNAQIQRLALIPVMVAVAVVISYVIARWMELHPVMERARAT